MWVRLRDGRLYRIRWNRYWQLIVQNKEDYCMGAPFGGKVIDFKGRKETVEDIFGKEDIGPTDMSKLLWAYVKEKGLMRTLKPGETLGD